MVSGLDSEIPLHIFELPFYRTISRRASDLFCNHGPLCNLYQVRSFAIRCPYTMKGDDSHSHFLGKVSLTEDLDTTFTTTSRHMSKNSSRYFKESYRDTTTRLNARCFRSITPEDTSFSQIDRWMLRCFLESPNWQMLAWFSTQRLSTESVQRIKTGLHRS